VFSTSLEAGREELDISRILFSSYQRYREGSYLSGIEVTFNLKRFTIVRRHVRKQFAETGKNPTFVSSDLAPNRGLPSQYLSILLVRSYRTFAPLPTELAVSFCGTILTLTRTGRYPASLGFGESGLSSDLEKLNPQPPR
jgi:hypothetical protein